MTNYAFHKHNLYCFAAHYFTKASSEISASFLKDSLSKGKKSANNAEIMHNYAN